MRIAICEDLPDHVRQLREALDRYLKANSLDAEVDCFASGEDFLAAFAPGKYQIIFMDIYMKEGGVTGIDAAEAVRSDRDASLIFTTTSEEFLHAGYRLSVYYIRKPVNDEELAEAMRKCWAQIERYAKTIEVVADRQAIKLRLRGIFSVESLRHTCVFTVAGGEITATNLVIDGLVEKLGGRPFVQCHRSYVVNLLHVKELQAKDFLMENGKRVPIGRSYYAAAQKVFKEYFWERIQGETV